MTKETISSKIDVALVGEAIPHELAEKMVKDYADQNPNSPFSFYVGRNIIDNILAQPGCVGIRIYNAINELGAETLVYAGIDRAGNTIYEYTTVDENGNLSRVEAIIGDRSGGGDSGGSGGSGGSIGW